ncbi:MAG: hypothetical protein JJ971_10695 [Balneolaceae bacterium]|nr:hypothetical protein [Balneolaceae bacterium]MBO6546286.1 hypothetical protein [Balneolaceae bacterium]MBO6648645.1 hypothetical protein [Balneolaceae bacterium]
MLWIYISNIVIAGVSLWLGYRRLFFLYQISLRKLLWSVLIALSLYSLLLLLFKIEVLTEAFAGAVIANVYASVFGFFAGSSINQYKTRVDSGSVLYCHRTFISEYIPVIVAIILILLGVHRSAIFSDLAITPIRVSSGLSLLGIGVWGITLRLVPEFRAKGIVLLDSVIKWDDLLSYEWYTVEILEVEYTQDEAIRSFKTLISPNDQLEIERLLSKKMREKLEKDN